MLNESFINRAFNETFLDTEFQRLSEIKSDASLTPKSQRFMCDTQEKGPAGKNFGPFYPRCS